MSLFFSPLYMSSDKLAGCPSFHGFRQLPISISKTTTTALSSFPGIHLENRVGASSFWVFHHITFIIVVKPFHLNLSTLQPFHQSKPLAHRSSTPQSPTKTLPLATLPIGHLPNPLSLPPSCRAIPASPSTSTKKCPPSPGTTPSSALPGAQIRKTRTGASHSPSPASRRSRLLRRQLATLYVLVLQMDVPKRLVTDFGI